MHVLKSAFVGDVVKKKKILPEQRDVYALDMYSTGVRWVYAHAEWEDEPVKLTVESAVSDYMASRHGLSLQHVYYRLRDPDGKTVFDGQCHRRKKRG